MPVQGFNWSLTLILLILPLGLSPISRNRLEFCLALPRRSLSNSRTRQTSTPLAATIHAESHLSYGGYGRLESAKRESF